MKRLICVLGVVLWAGAALAQESSAPVFEPVSAMFYLDMSGLNGLLEQNGFPKISTPITMTGSWTRVRVAEWLPLGLSIAEGSVGAERGARRVQLTFFYFSVFLDRRWPLSQAAPFLRGFVSGGLGIGTATLLLGQRALTEENFESVLQTAHDTLLRRLFLSLIPRAGIEFVLTDVLTLRASLGYSWAPWSGRWEHFAERIAGPPRDFSGVLVEFTVSYTLTPKPLSPPRERGGG
ncbi:MAG: hypothetical protein N3E42_02690 [Candidatus Bipolaricaulota bacterium]|nr:hypothetical protein [Candidatus Bipolaricaulota bacterium]